MTAPTDEQATTLETALCRRGSLGELPGAAAQDTFEAFGNVRVHEILEEADSGTDEFFEGAPSRRTTLDIRTLPTEAGGRGGVTQPAAGGR